MLTIRTVDDFDSFNAHSIYVGVNTSEGVGLAYIPTTEEGARELMRQAEFMNVEVGLEEISHGIVYLDIIN